MCGGHIFKTRNKNLKMGWHTGEIQSGEVEEG